jgi:hypothetical protein
MISRSALALGALLVIAGGCGDDPPAAKKRPARGGGGGGGGAKAAPAAAPAGGPALQGYPKIADDLRRTFLEKDFRPDSSGDANRDPFRSYIIRQPGLAEAKTGEDDDAADDICRNTKRKTNWHATNYSLRDLRLLGIIMRGTRGYAQFVDSSGDGHIVTQGNCLGVEKATVTSIGSGVVRLQVRPAKPLGGTAPPPILRDIPLFPEEYDLVDIDKNSAEP